MTSVLTRNAANTARTKPTTGDTKQSFVNTDHLGWLRCNGRALDTTTFNLLFQVIGYTFGGSGSSFQLPNTEGRVIGDKGTIVDACGTTIFSAGDKVGEVNHRLTIAEMPAHNHDATVPITALPTAPGTTTTNGAHSHGINDAGHSHGYNAVSGMVNVIEPLGATAVYNSIADTQTAGQLTGISIQTNGDHTHQIASNGGGGCHNNMQPTIFYGNTFIYCGVPIMGAPNTTVFPFGIPPANPVLI